MQASIPTASLSKVWQVENIPDTGNYSFTVPEVSPGDKYQIYISSKEKYGYSELFSIISKEETADWQTYTNEKYKFEFEYPTEYFLEEISDEEISISKYAEPVEFGYFGTDIKIIQNTQNLFLEEWLAQHRTDFGFGENDLIVGLERIKTSAGEALTFNETGFDLPYAVIELTPISDNLSNRQLIIISGGVDSDVFEAIIDTITVQP